MIKEIVVGDITSRLNRSDLIIGMNSQLEDVTGIGKRIVQKIKSNQPVLLGSVLSFKFDEQRNVHMIVCHNLGRGGWKGADMYVRFGMDYLWKTEASSKKFSIVEIGTGRIGKRDGADPMSIRTAMTNSFLVADLFIYNPRELEAVHEVLALPLIAYRSWNAQHGEERLAA